MNKITLTARYRLSLILYAKKHGVTKAAIQYRTNRQYIYRWMKRYDGTLQSLEDRSHQPHLFPRFIFSTFPRRCPLLRVDACTVHSFNFTALIERKITVFLISRNLLPPLVPALKQRRSS